METLTGDSALIFSRCLPSTKFIMLILPSLPSEVIKLEIGARSRMLIWALNPTLFYMRAMMEIFQILMVLSYEAETLLVSWFCENFWSMLVLINDELADTMDVRDLRFLSIFHEAICNDSRLRITYKWMEN